MAANLQLVITAKDQASGVLKNVDNAAGGLSKTLGTGLKLAGAAAAGGLGLAVVAGINFVKAAAEEEAGIKRLAAAVDAAGGSWEKQGKAIEGVIAERQKLAFSDDELRSSLALLTAITGDADEALRRQTVAMDFARGANIDLGTASKLLGKVTDETVNVLGRYGIRVKEGADATDVLALVQQKFAGQSAAFADSTAGKWAKFNIRIDNLKESIGARLLPVMVKLSEVGVQLADFLEAKVIPVVETLASLFGATLTRDAEGANAAMMKLPPSLQGVGEAVASVAAWIRDDLLPALEAMGKFIKDHIVPRFADGLKSLQEFYNLALKPVVDFILNNKVALIATITAIGVAILIALGPGAVAVAAILGFITLLGVLRDNWGEIKDFFNRTLNEITGFFSKNWQEILSIVAIAMLGPAGLVVLLGTNAFGIRDMMIRALNDVLDFFKGLPTKFREVGEAIGRAMGDGFKGAWNIVAQGINSAIPNDIGFNIPKVDLGPFGSIGGGKVKIDFPDNPIPQLAQGGIVTQPTLAMIGEQGPEAVVPLSKGMGGIVINFTYAPSVGFGSPAEMERAAIQLKGLLRGAL